MRRIALYGLIAVAILGLTAVVGFSQTQPAAQNPALKVYMFSDGSGVILYTNLTGQKKDDLVVTFSNPVKILTKKSFIIGGGAITQFADILANGTYWGFYTGGGDTLQATDFCQPGGTFQIYFQSVDKPATVVDAFLG